MISIEFDERSIFTYDAVNLEVCAWDHRDGKFDGPVIGCVGGIKFCDRWQIEHFMEMLEFMLDKLDKKEKLKNEKKS